MVAGGESLSAGKGEARICVLGLPKIEQCPPKGGTGTFQTDRVFSFQFLFNFVLIAYSGVSQKIYFLHTRIIGEQAKKWQIHKAGIDGASFPRAPRL